MSRYTVREPVSVSLLARGFKVPTSDLTCAHGPLIGQVPLDARYPRTQTLSFKNGYAVADVPVASLKPACGPADHVAFPPAPSRIELSQATRPFVPAFVQYEHCVLRFLAWFKEVLPGILDEGEYIRKAVVSFWPEDCSLAIAEPRLPNSGLMQGTLVARHRCGLGLEDFSIGSTICVRKTQYHLCSADTYTRTFFSDRGLHLGEDLALPEAPTDGGAVSRPGSTDRREAPAESPTRYAEVALGKAAPSRHTQQFLKFSNQVLRFFAVWNDTGRLCGDVHRLQLRYYLEDDTVEIVEEGEAGNHVFLRRTPAGSKGEGVACLGGALLPLSLTTQDLGIGREVVVHGRPILLRDADAYTKTWLKASPKIHRGVPTPPKRDQYKLMNSGGIILRFQACFAPPVSEIDEPRRFVISFFAADDTLSVFEPPAAAAGGAGSKFLERTRAYWVPGQTATLISEKDIWVGAVIPLAGRRFELLAADNFTLQHMELAAHPMARLGDALTTLGQALSDGKLVQQLRAALPLHGVLSVEELAGVLTQRTSLTRHQVFTLHRHLARRGPVTTAALLETLLLPPS
ncbi:EF-hand domain-containing protein 1 [Auxenochlorella protothecoides]|uniref:EF-hand domain-containing protein 1 n=1 Tax=Auxenochlorella protothecoides TaxID=3075 RepID=A0A087SR92_AUXPR|nr:EF-hand domain-containing protein 1 [Auxenochlorella protothecoides]KFM28246.1 EF-hand domain-containing protein 1 [Auxenochlorella protothecoides]